MMYGCRIGYRGYAKLEHILVSYEHEHAVALCGIKFDTIKKMVSEKPNYNRKLCKMCEKKLLEGNDGRVDKRAKGNRGKDGEDD